MKKLLSLLLVSALFGCGGPGAGSSTSSDGSGTDGSQSAETKAPKTEWAYSDKVNEMDDSRTRLARIEAEEELEFSFPYGGGTKVWINLRKTNSGTEAFLTITKDKGQFMPNTMGDRTILVRFDDKPAEKYSYTDPSDFSSETIFIRNTKKFIDNLKGAQKTIVQCEFFNEGTQTIKFDTGGLEWGE